MRKKVAILAYRDWAKDVMKEISFDTNLRKHYDFINIMSKDEFDYKIDEIVQCEFVFVIGWSWILPKEIVNNAICVGIHPSKLPKYRGGSPLQHQIIGGEKLGYVSFFILNEEIDKGNILDQLPLDINGNMQDILNRMCSISVNYFTLLLYWLLDNPGKDVQYLFSEVEADELEASYYPRRKPEQSEIKLEDFQICTAEELHNKIRALQDPYPNAFIICKDNTKLYLTRSYVGISKNF